ncbi:MULTISPECIES: hypothetical protein [Pseudomonas]|uniref:Uncharacterized protein n=1 Tax=Pseudomonas lutea TaxID=243924 RepID=A0A9X8MH23_9PSED|nr:MULTISPECIES: hypothetical protein [Pseudomonas]SER36110.1 hypothetical protein SAMN05216409_11838 [Pseudomonas lutea]
MLTNVPVQVARAQRQMVLRAPNSMECTLLRKKIKRSSEGEAIGGMPLLGGLGVLDSEDEPDYEYEEIGEGRVLFCGIYQAAPGNVVDSGDGVIYAEGAMECLVEPKVEGAFEVKKHDEIMVMPGMGFVLPYEVVGITSVSSIPPYLPRLIVEKRQDSSVGI